MRKLISFFTVALWVTCLSCNPSGSTTENEQNTDATENENVITAAYSAAKVGGTHTTYEFNVSGQTITVTTPNERSNAIEIPDNMLRTEVAIGPEIANPLLVGVPFKIHYGPDGEVVKIEKETEETTATATYEDAIVFAGKIDYVFTAPNGETLFVTGGPAGEEEHFELPDNMLEETDDLPGGNPELIGQKFELTLNKNNYVTKVALVD